MKKSLILFLLSLLFINPCVQAQDNKEIHEFVTDMASANVKLRGKLQLFGDYKNDLSSLKFDQYIKLLKENETESNKGLSEMIAKADKHFFKAKSNTFIVAIYLKDLNVILFDDANTTMADSVLILKNGIIPDLKEFAHKAGRTHR